MKTRFFEDIFEVDHVVWLLEEYAAEAKRYRLAGQGREVSALLALEAMLREALITNGIAEEHELRDWNEVNWLLEYPSRFEKGGQHGEAYARALRAVLSALADGADLDEALPALYQELYRLHALEGDIARDERDRLRDSHRRGPAKKLTASSRLLHEMYRAACQELGRPLTASQLIVWGKSKGQVQDLGADLRLKMPDGRTATIQNDMKTISDRLRSLKRHERPIKSRCA